MNVGYLVFAIGVIGVVFWSGSLSASTDPDPGTSATACVQTLMGDIATCD